MNSKKAATLVAIFTLIALNAALAENSTTETATKNKFEDRAQMRQDKAEERQGKIQERKENQLEKFCEKLSDLAGNFGQKADERASRVRSRKENRLQNWEGKQTERDAKLAEWRFQRDSNLEEHFKKLKDRIKTEDQEKAVNAFVEAMRNAIETRRDAVDQAMADFRNGVKTVLEERKTDVDSAMDSFQSAKAAAFEKAQKSCSAGTNAKTIRLTLHSDLKTAQSKFVSERKALSKNEGKIQELIEIRRQAVKKAMDDFHTAAEKARVELKSAFGEDDTPPGAPSTN